MKLENFYSLKVRLWPVLAVMTAELAFAAACGGTGALSVSKVSPGKRPISKAACLAPAFVARRALTEAQPTRAILKNPGELMLDQLQLYQSATSEHGGHLGAFHGRITSAPNSAPDSRDHHAVFECGDMPEGINSAANQVVLQLPEVLGAPSGRIQRLIEIRMGSDEAMSWVNPSVAGPVTRRNKFRTLDKLLADLPEDTQAQTYARSDGLPGLELRIQRTQKTESQTGVVTTITEAIITYKYLKTDQVSSNASL